ncbi:Glycoside hydrolase 31 [Phytophthora palmivora]|uniref:Glycoside hydrolase 31 n=1 Tax=Phytophthora palmivora TaxID=4796 RepID=A0A2P4YJ70_9STRA|nr:Glycoside hydrolase 31 [Phytophthora palmivora]
MNQSVTFTPNDTKWIPGSARFVALGIYPKATGALTIYGGVMSVWDLEKPDVPVYSAQAHKSIVNAIDGCGGQNIGSDAPEIVIPSKDSPARRRRLTNPLSDKDASCHKNRDLAEATEASGCQYPPSRSAKDADGSLYSVCVDCYPPSANFPDPTEELCLAQGCCWKSLENDHVPCAFAVEESPSGEKCKNVAKPSRLACRNPRFASSKLEEADACESAGCCFEDGDCFQPMSDGYELLTLDETSNGWSGTLALRHGNGGPFGNDVPLLELRVVRESSSQVRIRITDPAFPRYEVPDLPLP